MYLTANSSLVFLSLTNLATPKFPEPSSFNGSYFSSILAEKPKIQEIPKMCIKLNNFQNPLETSQIKQNPEKSLEIFQEKDCYKSKSQRHKDWVLGDVYYKDNKRVIYLFNY